MPLKLDIIGDIHGQVAALRALGAMLGYNVENEWTHREDRILVFLGDLVDGGTHSLEVAELVRRLVEDGNAACLMGNHEYNLVAWKLQLDGYKKPKASNRATIQQMAGGEDRWDRVLGFLRDLPVGIELPDLRIIHACWHVPSFDAVKGILAVSSRPASSHNPLAQHIVLSSPFTRNGLKAGLEPWQAARSVDSPHELLFKGLEAPAKVPFIDNHGKEQRMQRVSWWLEKDVPVLRDRPQVFGHYWHIPPADGKTFCPPFRSGIDELTGRDELKDWAQKMLPQVARSGRVVAGNEVEAFCVDFNGFTKGNKEGLACVGALRWPEREVVWATAPRT